MIVARCDVRDERAEYIKRCAVAQPLLDSHVGGNLIDGHVAGAFHHYLYVLFPGAEGQVAQLNQFRKLARIGAVMDAAGRNASPRLIVTSYSRRMSSTSS